MSQEQNDFKLLDLLFLFFIFIIAQLTLINIFTLINNLLQFSYNNADIIYSLISYPLILSIMIYWVVKYKNTKFQTTLINFKTSPQEIIALLISSSGLNIILSEVNNISQIYFPISEKIITKLNELIFTDIKILIIFFLVTTTTNIILKEILFRGLILNSLIKKYNQSLAVIAIASFQTLINFSLYNMVTIFTVNILLGWLYLKTNSTLSCIIANLSFNLGPYFLIYFTTYRIQGFNTEFSTTVTFQPLWFNLLGILLLGMGVFLFINQTQD